MVGLTLTCALASAGIAVTVIDRESAKIRRDAAFDGRTSAIARGSQQMLAALGAWEGMSAEAEPIREIRVSDGASPLFLHYDGAEVVGGPLGYIIENRVIRQALMARIAELPLAVHAEGRTVLGIERGSHRIEAGLDDGGLITAQLAIAADGRDSPLRHAAGIGVFESRYSQTGIVCTVAHERPHRGIAQERFLSAGPFAILPMTGNRSSIVWTEREDLAPSILALDEKAFAAELAARFGDYLGQLRIVGPTFNYPLGVSHAKCYTALRLALIGDAAHAIHPIAGQGLNLGLRDVAALAEVLVEAHRLGLDLGAASALDRYERWRRFDNSLMMAVTDGLNRLFSNDIAPVRAARDLGLAVLDRAAPVKNRFMNHAMGLLGDLPRLMRGESL